MIRWQDNWPELDPLPVPGHGELIANGAPIEEANCPKIEARILSVARCAPSPTSVALGFLVDYFTNGNDAAYIGGSSFVIDGSIRKSVDDDLIGDA